MQPGGRAGAKCAASAKDRGWPTVGRAGAGGSAGRQANKPIPDECRFSMHKYIGYQRLCRYTGRMEKFARPLEPRLPLPRRQAGFTLIELSIVLVIIGLIVGGVLVGQDLIKAAEIRATVAQIEKYNAAVNTFKIKFNGLPGDLNSVNAAAFGFTGRDGSQGRGDGNGLIEGYNAGVVREAFTQEAGILWNDLSVANLIDGNYTVNAANQDAPSVGSITTANVSAVFPLSRI
jgi:prepilin-type N-terminal cleavage/methylation domain-containing protein